MLALGHIDWGTMVGAQRVSALKLVGVGKRVGDRDEVGATVVFSAASHASRE